MKGALYQSPRSIARRFELAILQIKALQCDTPSIQVYDGPEIVEKGDVLTLSTGSWEAARIQGLQYIIRK